MSTAFEEYTRRAHAGMRRRAREQRVMTGGRWVTLPQVLPFDLEGLRTWLEASAMPRTGGYVYRCAYCGAALPIGDVQLDHAVPVSRGGGWGVENLRVSCKLDNQTKGELTGEEYVALLAALGALPSFARSYTLKCLRMVGLGARLQRSSDAPAAARRKR